MRCALLACLIAWNASAQFAFRTNDVIAFLGGTDVVTAQDSGHLETILTIQHAGLSLRFRNFGWEGDTVFTQPRDFGFPPLEHHLKRAGVTVIVFQFGRAEALEQHPPDKFASAYSNFLARFTEQTSRFLLVIPPPFERAPGLLPDLTRHNPLLGEYATVIRRLGHPFIDLSRVTNTAENGLHITPEGHALLAKEFALQLGIATPDASSRAYDEIRQAVVSKNRLWFHYWRPQNWAFLGGDRTSVPSSRDHRDPKVRWFPAEMEKFLPLIAAHESGIHQLSARLKR